LTSLFQSVKWNSGLLNRQILSDSGDDVF
jgi:hypothetical protein